MYNMSNLGNVRNMHNTKYIAVLFLAILVLSLSACGRADDKIDGSQWKLATVQSLDECGSVIAYGTEIAADAVGIELSLSAQNGKLTMVDSTNDKIYEGTYSIMDSGLDATIFTVAFDGENGTAVLSDTNYADGTTAATLILTVGDYVLNFQK